MTSNGPQAFKFLLKRKNIEYLHKINALSDEEAAIELEKLKKEFSTLVKPEPITLTGNKEIDEKILYYGPFKRNMTKKEARYIIGLTKK